jgi:hypothetical protein
METGNESGLDDVLPLLLQRPGLECWARTCMSLLALTQGITSFMDDEDEHPHRDMRRYVIRALSKNDPAELLKIARLHAFSYRAMSEAELALWQPLNESFRQFKERHGGRIRVWKELSSHPSRVTIEQWLLAQVSLRGECQQ